jgi:hypothetical protein
MSVTGSRISGLSFREAKQEVLSIAGKRRTMMRITGSGTTGSVNLKGVTGSIFNHWQASNRDERQRTFLPVSVSKTGVTGSTLSER